MAAKQKKELTPTQQMVKTVLNWVVNILCIILIIFALVVAIFTIIRAANPDNITRVGDDCYFNVASNSMKPVFSKSDVIIAKAYNGKESDGKDLKVGVVITFKSSIRGSDGKLYEAFNSHRIIHINLDENDNVVSVNTRGDNQKGAWQDAIGTNDGSWDPTSVAVKDIVATWGSVDENLNFTTGKMLKGVGGLANFVQDPVSGKTRFFCIVVLPLILLFVIYAFILVRTLIIAKLDKERKVMGETAISLDTMTEEEKQLLMQQLLAANDGEQSAAHQDDAANEEASSEDVAKTEQAEAAEPQEAVQPEQVEAIEPQEDAKSDGSAE